MSFAQQSIDKQISCHDREAAKSSHLAHPEVLLKSVGLSEYLRSSGAAPGPPCRLTSRHKLAVAFTFCMTISHISDCLVAGFLGMCN